MGKHRNEHTIQDFRARQQCLLQMGERRGCPKGGRVCGTGGPDWPDTGTASLSIWVSPGEGSPTPGQHHRQIHPDLYDRKVISRDLSADMETVHTTIPAIEMAFANRKAREGLLFHSDRGVGEYCAKSFRERLEELCFSVCRSMSRKGNCWDNACAELFFKTLKRELETGAGSWVCCSPKVLALGTNKQPPIWSTLNRGIYYEYTLIGTCSEHSAHKFRCFPLK
jgi:transposase InsO family protein